MTKKHEDICFGAMLRRRRLAIKRSQLEVATHAGISYQQIQKYESGTNRVAFSTILALAAALDCEAAELVADAIAEMKQQTQGDRLDG